MVEHPMVFPGDVEFSLMIDLVVYDSGPCVIVEAAMVDFWHFRFQLGGNGDMAEMFGEISFLGIGNSKCQAPGTSWRRAFGV